MRPWVVPNEGVSRLSPIGERCRDTQALLLLMRLIIALICEMVRETTAGALATQLCGGGGRLLMSNYQHLRLVFTQRIIA